MASGAVVSTPTVPASTFVPTPSPTSSCANQLLIQLTTTLLVPDYNRYYPEAPIDAFKPTYVPLADGSLVARPLIDDIVHANVCILVTGILVMLFARNIVVSGDYLRRVNLKDKTLFHVLFVSQLLASVALVPTVMSQFNQYASCSLLDKITTAATIISLSLLIIWILGYKAYRCLNSSRLVVAILLLFLFASSAIGILELLTLRSERRLSGACVRSSNLRWIRIYLILQFVESFFICCCFLFSVWRTRHSPRTRGRISLQLSLNRFDLRSLEKNVFDGKSSHCSLESHPGLFNSIFRRRPIKESLTPPIQATSLPRQTSIRISESSSHARVTTSRSSQVPSTLSRIMPRIDLFRDVMKDELYYTTFITASCVGVAATALFGANTKNALPVLGWVSLNWAVISLLAVSSFGRVIRRHERDIILREPETWVTNLNSACLHCPERHRRQRRARHSYSLSLNSNTRSWRKVIKDGGTDPCETAALNGPRCDSWASSNHSLCSETNFSVTGERPMSCSLTQTSEEALFPRTPSVSFNGNIHGG